MKKSQIVSSTDIPLPGRSIKITTKGELLWIETKNWMKSENC